MVQSQADVDTSIVYQKFDFQPAWMKTKEYWDDTFERRYSKIKQDPNRPHLKVILVPHSHNDPGWLKTFEHYFESETRNILNHLVNKMRQHDNLTFIWSEISFLQAWWDQVHPTKQKAFKKFVQAGRIEITTGGWVMTDEANVHLFAMWNQLVEGHQWLKLNLNITPTTGWSIDPFGHGSTFPYILSNSGFQGTIIQRIHYAWKQWFAWKRFGDFMWVPGWEVTVRQPKSAMLTHNMPFDIYSIKHSCGPHPYTCLNFDFRKIGGEYTEYSIKAQFIDKNNLREKAELLLEQYSKAASLFPHNVALVPIGDDFRYNHEVEFDQQYTNYKLLVDFINENSKRYGTEISFGTPRNYFEAIEKRTSEAQQRFPTVAGDFFVYSDIFTEGRPAYWSGYFTTRPYLKILDRTVEHNLRNAEILYTIATNRARQQKYSSHLRILEKHYDSLTRARRHLALFQHHDAITGTSKHAVMRDYGLKLFEALQIANKIQEDSIESLLVEHKEKDKDDLKGFILKDIEKESYDKLDRKVPISMSREKRQIVMFNSLPQERSEVVIIRVNDTKIAILDDQNNEVRIQISPVWNTSTTLPQWTISDKEFEISFIVRLPPLSLSTYSIITTKQEDPKNFATIYCDKCFGKSDKHNFHQGTPDEMIQSFNKSFTKQDDGRKSKFQFKPMQPGDVQLENRDLRLLFDGRSGFLKTITHKSFLKNKDNADGASKKYTTRNVMCNVKFGAYVSAQFHSGAYLFKPDPNTLEPERDILKGLSPGLMIISGQISSELTALYNGFISHTTRIYNFKNDYHPSKNSELMRAVYLETLVDFGEPPKYRETELFLRLQTNIDNGDTPVFYTDSNSFQYHKRTLVPAIGPEGNYYPITSMAFIQDAKTRVTLITDHAQGAASLEPGYLEVMLDRRTLYDDSRGMGEGLIDNKPTVFKNWLLVESVHSKENEEYQLPSLAATRLADALNYPLNIYSVEEPNASCKSRVPLISHPLPCDMRLINLRILSDETYHQFPGSNALLMLHRQGYSCRIGGTNPLDTCHNTRMHPDTTLTDVKIKKVTETSLTGVKDLEAVKSLGDIFVEKMDLAMYRIDFEE
ncbi:alpha-mannosidase 2-like [Ctenocephalides felis]|uniref:alpha-mannosidase 2-like n=1 Tax=Ctenocephalides felis TaxID=7515 RepID=UPI000E6E4461|nr:alpha-mannosidase 2-like [Ctenocephalides felis]